MTELQVSESELSEPIPELSVILPALNADADFFRCVSAVRAALANKLSFEIVSVVPATEDFSGLSSPDLRIVCEQGVGIYAAMNTGLSCAKGRYVYFIGQDDVLLPEVVHALTNGARLKADIILGDVFWGSHKIFRNRRSPYSLMWTNWCHQATIYRRNIFREHNVSFPEKFRVQADHYVNIVLAAGKGLTVVKHSACIAWYSAEGFSATSRDSEFRAAFPQIVREQFGLLSFWIVVLRRALLGALGKGLPR